jgi:hypothetical protein
VTAERKAAADAARKPHPGCETWATFGVNFDVPGIGQPRPCRIHGDPAGMPDGWDGDGRRPSTPAVCPSRGRYVNSLPGS